MAIHQLTPPSEGSPTDSNIRKRVGKACDRCRLKKSKCDGGSPCSRCKADNAICVFGERKKSHDKVYPKGYVELLEQQQAQLVSGLQELYKRTKNGEGWAGGPLKDTELGHPLTHDILDRLGSLQQGRQGGPEAFEEDTSLLQQRLFENGATPMFRHQSGSSDSEHGGLTQYESPSSTSMFTNPFEYNRAPPTPTSSPYPQSLATHANYRPSPSYGNPTTAPASMNPAHLQRPNWPTSNYCMDDNLDYLQRLQTAANFELGIAHLGRQSLPTANGGPCLVPDLNDDDEFKSFLDQTTV
ncbi:MAG: hypothetical protein M1833_004227 [Piccolia ochrophora]|nr:MAG: hypothetical protein M1833_004227 [Piccolia ochrophora]